MSLRARTLAASLAAAAVLAGGCGDDEEARDRQPPPDRPAKVVDAGDREFDEVVESADGPVLVLFWAPWSGPDRTVLPYLDRAARERPQLTVVKVNVDRAPKAATRFEVLSIPTAMVLVDGRVRGRPVVGAYPRARWERDLGLDTVAPRR